MHILRRFPGARLALHGLPLMLGMLHYQGM